jgi:D-alanyl-D-alanine carboxypeptidase
MVRLLDDAFVQIRANPSLVAHAGVPWRNVAVNAPPVIASLDVPPAAGDDEDAAESAAVDDGGDDNTNVIAAPAAPRPNTVIAQAVPPPVYTPPPPAVVAALPPPRVVLTPPPPPVQPAPRTAVARFEPWMKTIPRPRAKPAEVLVAAADVPVITPKPRQVAALTAPPAKPVAKPHLRADTGEGDIGDSGTPTFATSGPRAWTIQIGAFADLNQARGQLASYAERSMDILGQAARIVIPFTGVDGHTLYRARFGPFVEREAREVCSRLTQRGQTCFTVLASSH